jgi:hypothetical protein
MMVKPLIPEMVQAVPVREVRLLVQMELERTQAEADLPVIPQVMPVVLQAVEEGRHSRVAVQGVTAEMER